MNTIRQAFKEAPRTMTIATVWLLWLVGMLVWVAVKDGILWAIGALAAAIVIGVGLHLLNRLAAKGDGIDQ